MKHFFGKVNLSPTKKINHTVFSLISAPIYYLFLRFLVWHLLESSTYFKVKEMDTTLGKEKESYSWKGELYYILSK